MGHVIVKEVSLERGGDQTLIKVAPYRNFRLKYRNESESQIIISSFSCDLFEIRRVVKVHKIGQTFTIFFEKNDSYGSLDDFYGSNNASITFSSSSAVRVDVMQVA